MKELLQTGNITELKNSQNIAYILEDPSLFSLTGYKVLTSQEREGFIKCARVLHNGKIKLLYFTSGHKNLKNMMLLIDTDAFIMIVSNIVKVIIEIKNNGFLSCQNLDLSFDKIFVDQHTFGVSLIYLPLQSGSGDESDFENDFKISLIKLIASTPSLADPRMSRVSALLSNGALSLNELYSALKAEGKGSRHMEPDSTGQGNTSSALSGQPILEFISLDSAHPVKLSIHAPEYVIGKNATKVHGVIGFNKAIGRVHCKFIYQNGQYFLIDGDGTKCSTNGTYINGSRLTGTQPYAVKNGDRVRLANSDFSVRIREV